MASPRTMLGHHFPETLPEFPTVAAVERIKVRVLLNRDLADLNPVLAGRAVPVASTILPAIQEAVWLHCPETRQAFRMVEEAGLRPANLLGLHSPDRAMVETERDRQRWELRSASGLLVVRQEFQRRVPVAERWDRWAPWGRWVDLVSSKLLPFRLRQTSRSLRSESSELGMTPKASNSCMVGLSEIQMERRISICDFSP